MSHKPPSFEGWSAWCGECETYRPLVQHKEVNQESGEVYFEWTCAECHTDVLTIHRTDPTESERLPTLREQGLVGHPAPEEPGTIQ